MADDVLSAGQHDGEAEFMDAVLAQLLQRPAPKESQSAAYGLRHESNAWRNRRALSRPCPPAAVHVDAAENRPHVDLDGRLRSKVKMLLAHDVHLQGEAGKFGENLTRSLSVRGVVAQ